MNLKEYVRLVSKEAVIDGVKSIKRYHLSSNRLISATNPLITDGVKAIKRHADARNSYQIKQNKINQFLAASSLSHLLDGWTYLSNAFQALLNGDEATAIHLGYYAELRSAMSILSTEGIGAFSKKHVGAFSNTTSGIHPNNYYKNGGGYAQPEIPTHVFVWDAMERWSKTSTKFNDDILKIFKVQGLNFFEITEFFHPTAAGSTYLTTYTIKNWLKEWCFDIKNYKNDRENRNEVSYRPQRIKEFDVNLDFKVIIDDLSIFWNVISPTPANKFDLLDKFLLRKLFSSLYARLNTTQPIADLIANAFTQQGIYDNTLLDFMAYQTPFADEHLIFTQANIKKTTAISIIARATLLLRISVGLVSQLYKAGGITKSELNFVWNNYSIDNGFWSSASPLTNYDHLWLDIESMFDDLKRDINTPGVDNSIFSIRERNPIEIMHLSQINRACLWGLDM